MRQSGENIFWILLSFWKSFVLLIIHNLQETPSLPSILETFRSLVQKLILLLLRLSSPCQKCQLLEPLWKSPIWKLTDGSILKPKTKLTNSAINASSFWNFFENTLFYQNLRKNFSNFFQIFFLAIRIFSENDPSIIFWCLRCHNLWLRVFIHSLIQ